MSFYSLFGSTVMYVRCIYHTIRVSFSILLGIILKPIPSYWIPKLYTVPPKCLSDPVYGVHKYVTVNGIKLHYVENGDPSKKLIVFIHGFPEFWYSWRYQLKEFAKDYWCVAFDCRGYGGSDKPNSVDSYRMNAVANDIRLLINALGRDKCILIGHDWGAIIGFYFMQTYTDMIEKYCMMGAPPAEVWTKLAATTWEQFSKSWYVAFFQMRWLPEYTLKLNDYEKLKVLGGKSEYFTSEDLEAYKYTFSQKGTLTSAVNYYRANIGLNPNKIKSVSKTASKLTKDNTPPGLFLLGEFDAYVSKDSGPAAEKLIPNLKSEVVYGVDHFLQQTSPVIVNKRLQAFLEQ